MKSVILLLLSNTLSKLGDVLFDYANNSFLVNLNRDSVKLLAIYNGLENITSIFFNLFGGVIADKLSRAKIIFYSEFLSGVFCFILSFLNIETHLMYGIVIVNVLLAVLSSFTKPAYKSFVREVVTDNLVVKVNSYIQTLSTIVKISGPILAMFLYKIIGVKGVLLVNSISFIGSSIIVYSLQSNIPSDIKLKTTAKDVLADLSEGLIYLKQKREIVILIIFTSLINFFLVGPTLLLPFANQMFPQIKANLYAIFLSVGAVGSVLGALLSAKFENISKSKLILILGYSGLGLTLTSITYLFSFNPIFIGVPILIHNLLLTIFNIHFFSTIQKECDSAFLGRVFGIIFTSSILLMPLANLIFSYVLKPDNQNNFLYLGVLILCTSLLFNRLLHSVKLDN